MTINAVRLAEIQGMITRAKRFVQEVYIPDLLAIAGFYKEWASIGGGTPNYMTVGEFPLAGIKDLDKLYFPRGVILNNDLSKVHAYDHMGVTEGITSSWYTYTGGDKAVLHPYDGETAARYTGPKPPWEFLQDQKDGKYTWMKSPRYNGKPMQVGPLARMLVAYGSGHKEVVETVNMVLKTLGVGPAALFSTLGRTAARGIETLLLAERMQVWFDQLVGRIKSGDTKTFEGSKWEPSSWPKSAKGYGWLDAPRGALGHWVIIENEKILRYQCVVPSTWNCSPRDEKGVMGPYEAALTDHHPLVDPKRPLEILRTIHSFDPCMACGVHVIDVKGDLLAEVKVQ
jgi:Ni,Fe-hydrogenase I large subunit